ncbi:MAG TPA: bifunctional alpha,alpha-trehalose-phosphate synthase (UDP-forming)/trehalose-phosphatase, partial [Eubacteriaceae bacterium]|nr:bifunctional alpha,alpha-trehalose-phosphate synthase (UDP-forming)/trehalose-phosphatase [Eubacteriaceae bacterium]
MSKTIFVSNRLPVTIKKSETGFEYEKSIGGLATGLSGFHEKSNSVWVGWPGITLEESTEEDVHQITNTLQDEYKCLPVFMSEKDINQFYYGFCNETIWPLFHYFIDRTVYNEDLWESYKKVNQLFFDKIAPIIEPGDTLWIHDYQLMLLPEMVKKKFKDTKIGFFLHIPFPSFEIYRLLVWREEILRGLLGSDLIGFHTYDYVRHFLSSVRRILGYEHHLYQIAYEKRLINVEAFPMGIDYERFSKYYTTDQFQEEVEKFIHSSKGEKVVLSIDRLDYTKGIPERLKAIDQFLHDYPEYIENVRFHMIVAPSRVGVDSYDELRSEITELVSEINGKYGTVEWMPVWFYFQTFPQESLIALYRYSDVLLVTPLRDGMNLVSKEYIAARTDRKGM